MIKTCSKIFGIWCLFNALYILIICHDNLIQYLGLFILSLLGFITIFVAFIPLILLLYFLFKKIINSNYRVLITSFLIVLTNAVYFFVAKNTNFEYYVIIFSALLLFWFLPTIFLSVIFLPNSIKVNKKGILSVVIITEILGLLTIFLIGCTTKGNPFEKYKLNPKVNIELKIKNV